MGGAAAKTSTVEGPVMCRFPGRLSDDDSRGHQQQASGKRQGTKSREVVHRRCWHAYGDLIALTVAQSGERRMCEAGMGVMGVRGHARAF